jgi:hypothetical protein
MTESMYIAIAVAMVCLIVMSAMLLVAEAVDYVEYQVRRCRTRRRLRRIAR